MRTRVAALGALLMLLAAAFAGLWWSGRLEDWIQRRPRSWERPKRIVLVTLDTTTVSFLGAYNEEVDFTPSLDAFAAEGVTFEHAYTPTALTLPSHAALFSGLSPLTTGVMMNGDRLSDEVVTLAEILKQEGYETAAFVSLGVVRPGYGLEQGFDEYDADFRRYHRWYRWADEIVRAARRWITANQDEPFFLWAHLSDPHEPYVSRYSPPNAELFLDGEKLGSWNLSHKETIRLDLEVPPGRHELEWRSLRPPNPNSDRRLEIWFLDASDHEALLVQRPEELEDALSLQPSATIALHNRSAQTAAVRFRFRGRLRGAPKREILRNYKSEIEFMDRHFGRLRAHFAELGLEDETLWIVISDHGEGLFLHNTLGHSGNLFEEHLRTAWMMKGPGLPAGYRVSSEPALLMDVLPTLLEHLGLEGSQAFDGRSRLGCWQWRGCPPTEEWWAYGVGGSGTLHGVAGYRWPYKALWHDRRGRRGFQLLDDPSERRNLLKEEDFAEPLRQLELRVERENERVQRGLDDRSILKLTDERREMLRSLGYLR